MSYTSHYTEKRGHKCDVCGKRENCIRVDDRSTLHSTPMGWHKITWVVYEQFGTELASRETSREVCLACQTIEPWRSIIEVLRQPIA
jgi:hypothetical protein